MMFWILFITLFSVLTLKVVEGCTCFPAHPQTEFCKPETRFVIVARVIQEQLIPREPGVNLQNDPNLNLHWRRYRVQIHYRLKGGFLFPGFMAHLYTNGNGAMCGITYQIGRFYLIAGIIQDGRRTVGLCMTSTLLSNLTDEQRFLYGTDRYRRSCNCMHPTEQCTVPDDQNRFCYFRHAYCGRSFFGGCRWRTSNAISQCLQ